MASKYLFFSSECTPPAGYVLSKIYIPIENLFNESYSQGKYGGAIESIAIIPICCAKEWLEDHPRLERKYVSRKNKYADFRLYIDFEKFIKANEEQQIDLFSDNVHNSIEILAGRVYDFQKDNFLRDFDEIIEQLKNKNLYKELSISTILDERFFFIHQNTPEYIGGIEIEKSGILYSIYSSLPCCVSDEEKDGLFKEKLFELFKAQNNCFPEWKLGAEWPMLQGKPMRFLGQCEKKIKKYGEFTFCYEFFFEDIETGIQRTIIQML